MPFDDTDDDDTPVGGAPLPPDDRLWRHPSEIGAALGATLLPTATPNESSNIRLWSVAVVAGLIGSALSLGVVAVAGNLSHEVVEKPVIERVGLRPVAELSFASSSGPSVIALAKSVAPAIARIEASSNGTTQSASAILVRDDGHLVTNAHIVEHATTVQVVLADGTTLEGRVVGTDPMTDVAVVKVDRDHLPVAILGSAVDLQSGQPAIAIGSPLGSAGGPSVTVGVISAVGRRIYSTDGVELHDMIQTDSPMATGASGGALCDSSGSLIGMITAVSSSNDSSVNGLEFATPVDIVRAVSDDIIATGTARHPWLGLEGADVDAANAKGMGITGGAKITKVMDDSPAAQAGLQPDDVIVTIDGAKVTSMSAFVVALRSHHPGDSIALDIMRGISPQQMTITLGEKNHA